MSGMHDFTLASARDALKARKISAVELTNAHLDAIERLGTEMPPRVPRSQTQEQRRERPEIYVPETRCPPA